jgi:hypothetical protein
MCLLLQLLRYFVQRIVGFGYCFHSLWESSVKVFRIGFYLINVSAKAMTDNPYSVILKRAKNTNTVVAG